MIQLTFEPAYDAYHCMFRVSRLMPIVLEARIEFDKLRIMDFYLCFPSLLDQAKLRREDRRFNRLTSLRPPSYAGKPDGRLAFSRMLPTQTAAIQTLALAGFIDGGELELGWVEATGKPLPAPVAQRAVEVNGQEELLIEFMGVLAKDYPLSGENGLKHRSALMEHRYDVV